MLDNLCWICLDKNTKMYRIDDTYLRQAYDAITSKHDMLDMSVYTCYMCTWFLNKCHKLMTQALKAQDIMKQYLETKFC
ncbi:unnamed protein product [Leptidea sinapis]|uniref:ZAD domain-containing protein n=1 Tax=Leptidea sinapis TaxID=189913 RepID=A0A5E4QH20_9NEOP|nr:unnamed protein product [Leptidea sinapis]